MTIHKKGQAHWGKATSKEVKGQSQQKAAFLINSRMGLIPRFEGAQGTNRKN
ncbi:osmotically inducible protein C [Salmonella bongori]|nr:osmotically inducible protein C [Salmonella bongori]